MHVAESDRIGRLIFFRLSRSGSSVGESGHTILGCRPADLNVYHSTLEKHATYVFFSVLQNLQFEGITKTVVKLGIGKNVFLYCKYH